MLAEHRVDEPGLYRSLADWTRLLEILDQEKEAIGGKDLDRLEQVIRDKEKLCTQISAARVDYSGISQAGNSTVRQIRNLAQQCQKLNASNHLLLMHMQNHTRQVLEIITGGNTSPELYTARGNTDQKATYNLLLEA